MDYRKWAVQISLGDQAVPTKIYLRVPPTVAFPTDPRVPNMSVIFSTEWDSMIRRLSLYAELMRLDDAILIDLDLKGYILLFATFADVQPWTFSPTVLTNDYYKLLLSEKWVWKKNDESSEGKVVKWVGPAQYEDAKTKTLMMLPTDYSLVQVLHLSRFVINS